MKFTLLAISLFFLTGCFNSDTPKEKSSPKEKETLKVESNTTAQKDVPILNSTIKTYTREEILRRRKPNTPIYSEHIATPVYSVFTEEDFVSADVIPVENNVVEQSELKTYIDAYLGQLQTLNIDGIISMTYPKLFKPINENLFRQYISTIVSSSQISVENFNTRIIYLGNVYPYENGEFAQIIYQSDITLNFLNPELYKDELSIRVLNNVLAGKYGQENININSTARTINIKKEEKLLAIKENNEEWKFIGDNPSYRRLYPRVLPMGILSQL